MTEEQSLLQYLDARINELVKLPKKSDATWAKINLLGEVKQKVLEMRKEIEAAEEKAYWQGSSLGSAQTALNVAWKLIGAPTEK